MLFGVQYVFIRTSSWMAFIIRRAYKVSGRWYFIDASGYWQMLTNQNRITDFTAPVVSDGSLVEGIWYPITKLVGAHVSMQPE